MSGLKLTMAASIYRPYKFVRTTTTTTTATTSATTASAAAKSKLSVGPNSTTDRNSLAYMDRHRISPRAHSGAKAHDKPLGFIRFTFRGHKCFSLSSHNFSSSEEKGGISGSSEGSSGLVADMGLEENNNRDHLYENGQRHGSPLLSRNWSDRRNHQPSMQHQNQPESSNLLTLPTILTLGRVAAVPLLVCTFYIDSRWGTTATTSIFIAAAITDWLDGYIARKMRLGSQFGAFLDPVADKLMVAATLVLLCTRPFEVAIFGQVPWLLPIPAIAIIGREITMSAVREWAASQNSKLLEAVAVNNLGKWKTATQMTALTILLATRDSSLGGSGILAASGVSLLYISAWLAVWSLVVYMRKIWKVLLK